VINALTDSFLRANCLMRPSAALYTLNSAKGDAAATAFGVVLPVIYFGFVLFLIIWYILLERGRTPPPVYVLESHEGALTQENRERAAAERQMAAGSDEEAPKLKAEDSPVSSRSAEDFPSAAVPLPPATLPTPGANGDSSMAPAPSSTSTAKPSMGQKFGSWLQKYFLGPVLGYHPQEAGRWVPAVPKDPFLPRYGVFFDCSKGVHHKYEPAGEGSSADLRGQFIPVSNSRLARARQVAQLLGLAVSSLKMVLFADVLAGMASGAAPVLPVALLFAVTALYLLYVRFVCPPAEVSDLLIDTVSTLCDIGTLVCAIMACTTNPTNFAKL